MNNDKEPQGAKDLTTAVDKREWLRTNGFTVGERGRFSQAMKDAIANAEKNGIVFIERGTQTTTVFTIDENGVTKEEVREVNLWAHHPESIRKESHYRFVGEGKARERTDIMVSVTEACNSCQYSLGWCYCETPTITYWKTGEVLRLG